MAAPYRALDIARYILAAAYENGDVVTNLKLQKLLYYAQAWYLVHHDGKKLFSDDIEARKFGPVIKEVYERYKSYTRSPIDELTCEDDITKLDPADSEYMDKFLGEFMDYAALTLGNIIHNEAPWKEAFDENNPEASTVISTDSLYGYYSKLSTESVYSYYSRRANLVSR
jgi:uncharacterized phage-associated protein